MNRRGFLQGILATATAPYVVTTAGVLMPVRAIVTPALPLWLVDRAAWSLMLGPTLKEAMIETYVRRCLSGRIFV